MIRWPADRAGPAWLWPAAGAAALLAHLALVLLLWDRPVLTPAGGGGGDGVRISLAPLGRGMPVGLAPAAPAAPAADAAASQADAGQADLPPAGTDGAAPADSPPAARQPDARTAEHLGPAAGATAAVSRSPAAGTVLPVSPGAGPPPQAASARAVPAGAAPRIAPDGTPDRVPAPSAAGSGAADKARPVTEGAPPRPRARPGHLTVAVPERPPGRPPDRAPAATAAAPATAATVPAAARDSPAPAGSPGTAPGAAAETADGPAMSGSAGTVADQGAGTGGAADPSLLGGYFGRIRAILERNRRYPPQAQAMRQQGVVVLAFALDREGRLLDWRILQTSGHRLLDAEAVDLLRRVAPLPPFPAGIGGDRLDLEVPIRFDL